jgi:DNA polymerase V
MADVLALDLTEKKLVTDCIVLTICYDSESLKNPEVRRKYDGEIKPDWYGRPVPKHAHGTARLSRQTASSRLITEGAMEIFKRTVNEDLLVRRIYIVADNIVPESEIKETGRTEEQLSLFVNYEERDKKRAEEEEALRKEKALQEATLSIKKRFGKNAILKGINFEEGATGKDRNSQIGGHKA